ncbi:MAG: cupin domain-containing protein [Alphaproteobacteria bacterium]|nr:cupin domain-containing protein [Alphaproteobacteria bacterium]
MTDKPSLHYWHLFTDANGTSRQKRCAMGKFDLKPIQPGAAPQWQGEKSSGTMTTMVTVLPVGWIGDWHENPKPQWIIPLSGRWFVEAMDGTRAEMGPGELAFGGDQNCKMQDGKTGHRSGTVGDAPAVLMIVQLDEVDAPAPCAFS